MIDLNWVLKNSKKYQTILKNRQEYELLKDFEQFINLTIKSKNLKSEIEIHKNEQNLLNKKFHLLSSEEKNQLKSFKKIFQEKIISLEKIENTKLVNSQHNISTFQLYLPNVFHNDVPIGINEKDNQIIEKVGTISKRKAKDHWKLLSDLKWIETDKTVQMTKSRFLIYKGFGAKLLRALKNLCLDLHIDKGYQEFFVPHLINHSSLKGTGQLPKLEDDVFKIENENLYLIPTSEVALVSFFQKTVFPIEQLPKKVCSYSLCFRKEAGAGGTKNYGLKRLHQFNKVELVQIVNPENSYQVLDEMVVQATSILKALEIPYRVISLCSGDLGISSAKTFDLEVWMPFQKEYWEISSLSNTQDFQARRLKIKYKKEGQKNSFVHTLNGSGLALDRLIACLIETHYNVETKTFDWPDKLKKYL